MDTSSPSSGMPEGYTYEGPEELRGPVDAALGRVIDPEVAMTILDVGLVYGVRVDADRAHVRMTMTSAACPVTDYLLDEVEAELSKVLPGGMDIDVELCWEPAWTPERISPRGKALMGW